MGIEPATLSRGILPIAVVTLFAVSLVAATDGNPRATDTPEPGVPASISTAAWPLAGPDNLDIPAEDLLPERVTAAEPVRIVSITRDGSGRPAVAVRQATDTAAALRLVEAAQAEPDALAVEIDDRATIADTDDTYSSSQWPLPTLEVAEAWRFSKGTGATVAVLDTGVDGAHPDLAAAVLPGHDTLDDAGDGRTDPHGHGTHVAGTIAAVANNGIGVAGVAPGARILPVRVLDQDGYGWWSDIASGVTWAADHGAQVINMSIGGTSSASSMSTAIAYARARGVTVIAAAGNSRGSGSPITYPAAYDGVIAVAATDGLDASAYFSNQGEYVDVAAPGVSVISTTPGGAYRYMSGTSMACPHAAAMVALLLEVAPQATPDEIEQLMTSTALDLGPAGWDDTFGHGRIRPVTALTEIVPAPTPTGTVTPTPTETATPSPSPTGTVTPSPTPTPSATGSPSPTPSPSTTVAKVRPVVQILARASSMAVNTTATTRFTVTANGRRWASRPATLCVATSPALSTYRCAAVTTSSTGTVIHSRLATATYRIYLRVNATPQSYEVTSRTHTYRVRPVATLKKNGRNSLRAAISGSDGQLVYLQRYQGSRWVTVSKFRASSSRNLTGLRAGYRYRLYVAQSSRLTNGYSSGVRL